MCKFEENVKNMKFDNCNLFKRSFTTQGLGYTFNNEKQEILIKENFRNTELPTNLKMKPYLMKSTKAKHLLKVVIENNAEEISVFEDSKRNYFTTF